MVSFGQCLVSGFSGQCLVSCAFGQFFFNVRNVLTLCFLYPTANLVLDTYCVNPYSYKLVHRCSSLGCVSNPDFYPFYARSLLFGEPVKFVPSLYPYTYKNSKADERIFMKCGIREFYLKLLLSFSFGLNGPHLTFNMCTFSLV